MIRLFIVICIIFTACGLHAQNGENQPYSRFGIGAIKDNNLYHLKDMGSLGTSYHSYTHINISNPASFSRLLSTAFDVGVDAKRSVLSTANASSSSWSGNLGYLALAFPLYNPLNRILDREEKNYSFGMGLSLRPYSDVSYKIASETNNDDLGRVRHLYTGDGNTSEFLVGLSGTYKNFSLGASMKYLFGSIEYARVVALPDQPKASINNYTNSYKLRGFAFELGALYHLHLSPSADMRKAQKLTLGATFDTGTKANTSATILHLLEQPAAIRGRAGIPSDTIRSTFDIKGKARIPKSLGVGAHYLHKNKFMIGVDYKFSQWSTYFNEANDDKTGSLSDGQKLSIGGYYRPDYSSYSDFYKRIYYRYGFVYEKDGRLAGDMEIDRLAVTFGLGLPFSFQRKQSQANIGIELGILGRNTPISERYLKLRLSFNFSDDEWFLKTRYN